MDPEIERRNAEVEARGREIERAFAELEKRSAPKAAEAPPAPVQRITYESDLTNAHIYSPAPDFMRDDAAAAKSYERDRATEKVLRDIAITQSEAKGNTQTSPDAVAFTNLVMDTQRRAGTQGHFDPMRIKTVDTGAKFDQVRKALPVPGVGPDYADQAIVMYDPDSGRGGGNDLTPAASSEVAELKAIVAAQQHQINALIQRLP